MAVRRRYRKAIIWSVVTAIAVVTAYCVAVGGLRRWISGQGVRMLSERLGTVVTLDSVDVNIALRRVSLYGLTVEDLQRQKMLTVDTASVRVGIMPLLRSQLEINSLRLCGVTALLYKERRDTAANYQFVIDAFKKKETAGDDGADGRRRKPWDVTLRSLSLGRATVTWDIRSAPVRNNGKPDAAHLRIENLSLARSGVVKSASLLTLTLGELRCREKRSGMALRLSETEFAKWAKDSVRVTLRRGAWAWRDMAASFKELAVWQGEGALSLRKPLSVRVDSLLYERDNGRPHKRTGRPHRGYFDAGHVRATLSLDALVRCATADSTLVDIRRLAAHDRASGLDIRSLTANLAMRRDTITLRDMKMRLPKSRIEAREIGGTLLRNAGGKACDVRIRPFRLAANMVLQDISRPFAPVLSDFTTPLRVGVTAGGTLARFDFRNIVVTTADSRLRLTASGDMLDVTKRFRLSLHFRDIRLQASHGVKEAIVGHFSKKVRMKMVRQMQKIGDIRYNGTVTVAFKREDIAGTLYTKYGNADFSFTINGRNKLMTGEISTDSLALGSIMNVDGLGSMKAKAYYGFNVASKKKSRGVSRGRLPIGWLNATVERAHYKRIKFENVSAVMHSDGSTAVGEIVMPKKLFDISLMFWYTQTDSVQSLRFKPKLSRHKQKDAAVRNNKKRWSDYMKEARERARAIREKKTRKETKSTN